MNPPALTVSARRTRARAIRGLALSGLLLGAGALLGGCFFSTSEPPPSREVTVTPTEPPAPTTATLVVEWTITGLTDPNECIKAEAKNIEISIVGTDGTEVGAYQQACSAFKTSITLNPGTYSAYAALLDDAGRTRTTDVAINQFTLQSNDSLTVPVDFPSNSFR
jgi:hypothetical protein